VSDTSNDDIIDMLVKLWLRRVWAMTGTAWSLVAFSLCCNPLGTVTILAAVAGLVGVAYAFMPPDELKPFIRGANVLPAGLSALALLVAAAITVLILMLPVLLIQPQ
jgi:hypothetical protein